VHFGQYFHKPYIFPYLGHERLVPDLLHLLLRCTAHLFTKLIRPHIHTVFEEDKILKLLKDHVKCFVRVDRTKKNFDATTTKINFIGRECKSLLEHHKKLVDAVLPRNNPLHAQACKAFTTFKDLWEELQGPIIGDRTTKALAVRLKAGLAIEALKEAAGEKAVTIYLHIAYRHFPGLIRRFGSLAKYGGDGLESKHAQTKLRARTRTNNRLGGGINKKTRQGRGRTEQLLQLEIAINEVAELVPKRNSPEKAKRKAKRKLTC